MTDLRRPSPTPEPSAVTDYLVPTVDSFWQWEDAGRVMSWADGKTISFFAELQTVLGRLAPRGLPPLGAVALLLAATRDTWRGSSSEPGILAGILYGLGDDSPSQPLLPEVLGGLDRVHYLEPDLRSSPLAKAELAELVFETCTERTSPQLAAAVLQSLSGGLPEEIVAPVERGQWGDSADVLRRDLQSLQEGLRRVDAEVLALRRRTGLDQPVEPAGLPISPAELARNLVLRLEDDLELSGLARLTRQLMAAVTLPRALADVEDLPLGGVSDISNRGPLDRLLLSELAQDDLTLAVRLALNEALFLRRESPPRMPPRRRAVLLETGIRSWGVPRVFATAVALALTATADRHMQVVCYRARGSTVEPVDLTTREGLVAHLQVLEAEAHPGAALAAWQTALRQSATRAAPGASSEAPPTRRAAVGATDAVLVTSDEVWADTEFQRALQAHAAWPLHVATVNRTGRFRLSVRHELGSKTLREATMNLDELFAARPRQPASLLDEAGNWPAIFTAEPFPLLLPHPVETQQMWHVEGYGVLAVTRDRRLMLWTGLGFGARQVADDLPAGALLWCSPFAADTRVQAVAGHTSGQGLHLLDIDLEQGGCEQVPLSTNAGAFKAVCSHNGALFVVFERHIDVLDGASGNRIDTFMLPSGMIWQRDRFFRREQGQRWYALSYDGLSAHLEPFLQDDGSHGPALLTLWERPGIEGPIGVTRRGDLYWTANATTQKVQHGLAGDVEVLAISRDGSQVVLGEGRANWQPQRSLAVLDVATLAIRPCYGAAASQVDPPFWSYVHPRNLRHRFSSIQVAPDGVITLTSRKQVPWRIVLDTLADCICLRRGDHQAHPLGRPLAFQPAASPTGTGYALRVAQWEDGSRAWLDSRGLLHLQSADASIPEVTIVLAERQLSGWCSDGKRWGLSYFLGECDRASPRAVFQSAIEPFAMRVS